MSSTQWAVPPAVYAVILTHADGHQTLVVWARTASPATLAVDGPDGKALSLDLLGNLLWIIGKHFHIIGGATCDDKDGCAVGGPPLILMFPPGEITLREGATVLNWQTGTPASSLTVAR